MGEPSSPMGERLEYLVRGKSVLRERELTSGIPRGRPRSRRMNILPPSPAGGPKTRPAGITVLAGIAVLLALYVASSSAAGSTAFRSAAAGTTVSSQALPIAMPAGTAAGDVLVAVVDAR